jgi:hypothetical protein
MIGEASVEAVADYIRKAELGKRFPYHAAFFVVAG